MHHNFIFGLKLTPSKTFEWENPDILVYIVSLESSLNLVLKHVTRP